MAPSTIPTSVPTARLSTLPAEGHLPAGFGRASATLAEVFAAASTLFQAGLLAGPQNPRIRRVVGIDFGRLLSLGLKHDATR